MSLEVQISTISVFLPIRGRALPPGTPLEAKGRKKEERGERRKKKMEEEEGAPLVLGLAPSLLPM